MTTQDTLNGGQTQPAPSGLGGKERLGRMCQRSGIHALAAVGNAHRHLASLGRAWRQSLRADCQGATAGHSIAGVQDQVEKHLAHLVGVRGDGG